MEILLSRTIFEVPFVRVTRMMFPESITFWLSMSEKSSSSECISLEGKEVPTKRREIPMTVIKSVRVVFSISFFVFLRLYSF